MTTIEDLRLSGLSQETISLMGIESVSAEEATDLLGSRQSYPNGGYKIPYRNVAGNLTKFFRIRFLPALKNSKGKDQKYAQKKGDSNHLYIPPNIDREALLNPDIPIIITEGEKKSAKACQEGYLCVGLGGVDNWMQKTVLVKGEAKETDKEGVYRVKGDCEDVGLLVEGVVPELLDIPWRNRDVFICFDSDYDKNENVQRAAFDLSAYMSERQEAKVYLIKMPPAPDGSKQGIDDFLVANPREDALWELAQQRWRAEPPNIRLWLRDKLALKGRIERDQTLICARAITNAMDNRGEAFRDPNTGLLYYFDGRGHRLHEFQNKNPREWVGKSIGKLIYKEYGLQFLSDDQVRDALVERMTHRALDREIQPRKVSWTTDDAFYYQLSDSAMIKVTATDIERVNNGTDNILFLADQVVPIEITPANFKVASAEGPMWFEAVNSMNLVPSPGLTLEEERLRLTALLYLSPWLRRWRKMCLPLEIVSAEAGSGKTNLYNLRKAIFCGHDGLNSAPQDVRSWHAILNDVPGIWVCDNLDQLNREMQIQFSDALAKLITDPDPTIETRELNTTMDIRKARIDCVFAITCIRENLMHKPDIQQRSIGFKLKAIEKKDGRWYERRIAGEGRANRIADQLLITQKFFQAVHQHWDEDYVAINRLKHFEQALLMMGIALNREDEMRVLIPKLDVVMQEQVSKSDPVMEALRAFADAAREKGAIGKKFKAIEIINWLMSHEFEHVREAENARKLGHYILRHESDVKRSCGIARASGGPNMVLYQILAREKISENS